MTRQAVVHVTLRRAGSDDCRRIWEWRNEASARQASFNTEAIPYDAHRRWYSEKMADPRVWFYLALDERRREVGYLRFDLTDDEAEISLVVDARERGEGLGTALVKTGVELMLRSLAVARVTARVRQDNPASRRLFERAGFVLSGSLCRDGIDAWTLTHESAGHNKPVRSETVRVLFRPDMGWEAGLGHVQRSLSLATALRSAGADCTFVAAGRQDASAPIAAAGFEVRDLPGRQSDDRVDLEGVLKESARGRRNAVVVDSYHVDGEYLGKLRAEGLFVVAIDDLAGFPFPCQLVVNGGAEAQSLPYRSMSGDTQFLLGPRYALLRPEFWAASPRARRDRIGTVLVTMGGADTHNLTPQLIRLLDGFPGAFDVTVIVGPLFGHRAGVEEAAGRCGRSVRLVEVPTLVRNLMLQADLAVSASGQTLYELAAAGVPTVAIEAAPNQAGNLRTLTAAGVVEGAGAASDPNLLAQVEAALRRLLNSEAARKRMSVAGQALVDGQGARRVAEVIVGSCTGRAAQDEALQS